MLRAPAPRGRFDRRDPRSFVTVSDRFVLLHGGVPSPRDQHRAQSGGVVECGHARWGSARA